MTYDVASCKQGPQLQMGGKGIDQHLYHHSFGYRAKSTTSLRRLYGTTSPPGREQALIALVRASRMGGLRRVLPNVIIGKACQEHKKNRRLPLSFPAM